MSLSELNKKQVHNDNQRRMPKEHNGYSLKIEEDTVKTP